ncbi:SH3 domain-containing protein [Lactiplantibacillus fabifermentans]|nr:SH3 domain-containing protein [Lactiplantibacillus fabifermentans]
MGMTKVIASLMLSTALLPMMNSKAATESSAPAPATKAASTSSSASSANAQSQSLGSTTAANGSRTASTPATSGSANAASSSSNAVASSAPATSQAASQSSSASASQSSSQSSSQSVSQSASNAASSATSSSSAATSATSAADSATATEKQAAAKRATLSEDHSLGPGFYDMHAFMARSAADTTGFLTSIKSGAIAGWRNHKVLPSITAAQAILESGWGRSELSTLGNNLFGIKGDYQGQSIAFKTQEFVNGQYITITDNFRKYPNWAASVEDHGAFLNVNPRYSNLLGVTDYQKVAALLSQDGYATAPDYAAKLIEIINEYNLNAWDTEAIGNNNTTTPSNPGNISTAPNTNQNNNNNNNASQGGSYTFKTATNIRNSASKGGQIVGSYDAGQSVRYTGKVNAEGLTWLQYTSYSGKTHYVAMSGDDVAATTPTPAPTPAPSETVVATSGSYRFTAATDIKSAPSVGAATLGTYNAGETVYYNGKVTAEGRTWLRYLSYSGSAHYVAISGGSTGGGSTPTPSQPSVTATSGSYRFTGTTAIKSAPDNNAATVGTYYAGNTVYYNGKVTANGQTWLRYQSYSGAMHYVAVGGSGSNGGNSNASANVMATSGSYRFTATTAIKSAPSNSAATVGTYDAGSTVYYNGKVNADGQTWLRYQAYSSATHYVAVGGSSATNNGGSNVSAQSGAFRFSTTTHIRTAPSTSASIVGRYYPDEVVYYNGKVQADGYTWLRYLSRSGATHYVAVVD